MRVKVQKWGNNLALRIPKPFAQEADVEERAVVNLSVQDGKLVMVPAARGRYGLRQLLRKVRKDNIHREIPWGDSAGREYW